VRARQVEHDATRGTTPVSGRCADFTKRSKCLGSELGDGNPVHPGRSSVGFEKKSPHSRKIRASRIAPPLCPGKPLASWRKGAGEDPIDELL
jgi:hypothetical protein